jgi:hypothetical protein
MTVGLPWTVEEWYVSASGKLQERITVHRSAFVSATKALKMARAFPHRHSRGLETIGVVLHEGRPVLQTREAWASTELCGEAAAYAVVRHALPNDPLWVEP